MMRIDFVTLFPEMVLSTLDVSMTRRAHEDGIVAYRAVSPRDFACDVHRTVDDTPYGGGPGMLLKVDLIAAALESLSLPDEAKVLLTDPSGRQFDQASARKLSHESHVVWVCGHYGGVDDRVRTELCHEAYSIGDYVLTGGELPALVMTDAVVRLLPGVLGSPESLDQDAVASGLIGEPRFTRPETFRNATVPEVLRSGNHAEIGKWRRSVALRRTRTERPDLFWRASLEKSDLDLLS